MCESVGVSWMLDGDGRDRIVKHGGATNGFLSSFELLPGHGFGCTVLTNSDSGREARTTVLEVLREHFTGVGVPAIVPATTQPALGQYAGRYQSRLAALDVVEAGGRLDVREVAPQGINTQVAFGTAPMTLAFTARDRAVVVADGPRKGERAEFLRDANGAIAFMRWDGRLAARIP